jgi:large subunit ribosomal protein L6
MFIKMAKKELIEEIEFPEGVNIQVEKDVYTFKGKKGIVVKKFNNPNADMSISGNKLKLIGKTSGKSSKAIINTYKAHILNAIKGCQEGYVYKLKVCSGHFPMNISISNNKLIIKNFLGEKVPREVKLKEGVDVKIDGAFIFVEGPDKDKTGQMAASIEQTTRRPGFDKRIFQDGIYAIEKAGKEI